MTFIQVHSDLPNDDLPNDDLPNYDLLTIWQLSKKKKIADDAGLSAGESFRFASKSLLIRPFSTVYHCTLLKRRQHRQNNVLAFCNSTHCTFHIFYCIRKRKSVNKRDSDNFLAHRNFSKARFPFISANCLTIFPGESFSYTNTLHPGVHLQVSAAITNNFLGTTFMQKLE